MKFTLLILIVAAVVTCALCCTKGSWSQYKQIYGKSYNTKEDHRRKVIYCKNLKTIEKHNESYKRGETTYQLGINQFSDWTEEEFNAYVSKGLRLE